MSQGGVSQTFGDMGDIIKADFVDEDPLLKKKALVTGFYGCTHTIDSQQPPQSEGAYSEVLHIHSISPKLFPTPPCGAIPTVVLT